MPPKNSQAPPPTLEVEPEVHVPEEVGPVAEPSFCLVLGHLTSHHFVVRDQPSSDAQADGEAGQRPTREFDPGAVLLEKAKQPGDPAAKRVVLIEREELQAFAEEGKGLCSGLRVRLQKEREARSRLKSNAARRKAIAAFEAAKAPHEAAADAQAEAAAGPVAGEVDVLVLLKDFPHDAAELQEIAHLGLMEHGIVNLWCSIYLAGRSLQQAGDADPVDCQTPELPLLFYAAVQHAETGSEMSNCTVCTLPDSHMLAFANEDDPADHPPADRVQAALLRRLSADAAAKQRFSSWLQRVPQRVHIPDAPAKQVEDRLYRQLMGSLDPAQHDMPLFLHCLTEQVERTLGGSAQRCEDDGMIRSLQDYLKGNLDDVLTVGSLRSSTPRQRELEQIRRTAGLENGRPVQDLSDALFPHLDRSSCHHRLCGGPGGSKLGGEQVQTLVQKVLDEVRAPGVKRSGLPRNAVHSAAAREALIHRIYPFAPGVSPVELEQHLLLYAFEELMGRAEPERKWCFTDRIFRERIPKELLPQVLEAALQSEPFVDMAYLPRYDCLLVALHQRSLPGRLVWHAWHGDLLAESTADEPGLCTMPTFNDWAQASAVSSTSRPPRLIENVDARSLGYGNVVEKLATPSDGSLILVSRLEYGLRKSFEEPANSRESFRAGRHMSRLARVLKDNLTFGIVPDRSWENWRHSQLEHHRQEAADAEHHEEQPQGLPFAGAALGSFWVVFPNGARCTARMHHEQALGSQGLAADQWGRPLPSMGVLLTYSMAAGQVVQVFSDGAVRLTCPASAALSPASKLAMGAQPRLSPGCDEDAEVTRTIMPSGTIVRKLLSGRLEAYHADGTLAIRNPTMAEVLAQLEAVRAEAIKVADREEVLQKILKVYSDQHNMQPLLERPSYKEKATGLPGHWVIIRPDGLAYGRAPLALQSGHGHDPNIEELLDGALVDDGNVVEYNITGMPYALQVDLQSKHRALTNSLGLASFEDAEGQQKVSVHNDGTRVTRSFTEDGYDVEIFKESMPTIRCEIRSGKGHPFMKTILECPDGTVLEVVPQTLAPSGYLQPLASEEEAYSAAAVHASVVVSCREGHKVTSYGDGRVDISGSYREGAASRPGKFTAHCNQGRLLVCEGEYQLHSDQSVTSPGQPESPRCSLAGKAYGVSNGDRLPAHSDLPKLRLFAVYGAGEAEELISVKDATEMLEAAREDAAATVVSGQAIGDRMPGCKSHTIFRTRYPDRLAVPLTCDVALFEGVGSGEALGSAACSVLSTASQMVAEQALRTDQIVRASAITEYRQIIEFPAVTEEVREKFYGTLKQYRKWEAEELAKSRAVGQPDQKGKKDAKKEAKKPEKKADKKKKGAAEEPTAQQVELPPEPAFVQDLHLSPFDHHVKVLQLRAIQKSAPSIKELLDQAVKAEKAIHESAEEEDLLETVGVADGAAEASPLSSPRVPARKAKQDWILPSPKVSPRAAKAKRRAERPKAKSPQRQILDTEFSFAYFQSEMGLQFLIEQGELDPDCKPKHPKRRLLTDEERASRRAAHVVPKRTPWNPRLVGEPDEEEERLHREAAEADDRYRYQQSLEDQGNFRGNFMPGAGGHEFQPVPEHGMSAADRHPFAPNNRPSMVPEKETVPTGPHPDKKGPLWDVYGEMRPAKNPVSQAYVSLNTDYLEVEGATDRRIRTSSIALKKNSARAPNVSAIRKRGMHAIGRGSEASVQDLLGGPGACPPEELWRLSSSMQGLGDPNQLVEVVPGACRFGPLRLGSLHRMVFYLRNLDVDVTRFNISPVKSDFVLVHYQPGHLAPGMAAKIVVEVAARSPAKIEQLVEIKVKAHIIRVPVTARVFDVEEYDRLDAESLALHGRRIGRYRERTEDNKPGPVELVVNESYCRKVLGDVYLQALADQEIQP